MRPCLSIVLTIASLFGAQNSFALPRWPCANYLRTGPYDDVKTDALKWKNKILESKRDSQGRLLRPDLAPLLAELEAGFSMLLNQTSAVWHPVLSHALADIKQARAESLPERMILDLSFRYAVAHVYRNEGSLDIYNSELEQIQKSQEAIAASFRTRTNSHVLLPTMDAHEDKNRGKTDLAGILIYPLPPRTSAPDEKTLEALKSKMYFASVRTENYPIHEHVAQAGLNVLYRIRNMPQSPLRLQLTLLTSQLSWLNERAFLKGSATSLLQDKRSTGEEATFFREASSMSNSVNQRKFGEQTWRDLFLHNRVSDWEYALRYFIALVDSSPLPKRKANLHTEQKPPKTDEELTLQEKTFQIATTAEGQSNPLTTRSGIEGLLQQLVIRYYGSHSMSNLLDNQTDPGQFTKYDANMRFLLTREQVAEPKLPKISPVEAIHLDYHTRQQNDPTSHTTQFTSETEQDLDIPNALIESTLSYKFKGHGDSSKVRRIYFGKRLEYISKLQISAPQVLDAYEKIRFNVEGHPTAKTIIVVTTNRTYRIRLSPSLQLVPLQQLQTYLTNLFHGEVAVSRTGDSYFRVRYTTRLAKNDESKEIIGKITIDQILSLSSPEPLPTEEMVATLLWGDPARNLEYAFRNYNVANHVRGITSRIVVSHSAEAEVQATYLANDLQEFLRLVNSPAE